MNIRDIRRFVFSSIKMANELLKNKLKTCDDKDFFDNLEKCVEFRVPLQLKNILTLNLCNNAVALSRGITQTIEEIERFMSNDFEKNMLKGTQTMEDYLGLFVKSQKKFRLMSGQRRMLIAITEFCQSLYPIKTIKTTDDSSIAIAKANVPVTSKTSSKSVQVAKENIQSEAIPSTSQFSSTSVRGAKENIQSKHIPSSSTSNPTQQKKSSSESGAFIKLMFDELYTWMTQQNELQEALTDSFAFQLSSDTYIERDDNSISYTVKCPFQGCKSDFALRYKRYPSYYVHKKGIKKQTKSSNVKPPKWNYQRIKKHFLHQHSSMRQGNFIDSSNDNESSDDSNDYEKIDLTKSPTLVESESDELNLDARNERASGNVSDFLTIDGSHTRENSKLDGVSNSTEDHERMDLTDSPTMVALSKKSTMNQRTYLKTNRYPIRKKK